MALRDYILCGKCDAKVIYDGDDRIRDNLFDRTHEAIRCAACAVKDIEELHDLRAQLAERDKELERLRNERWHALTVLEADVLKADATIARQAEALAKLKEFIKFLACKCEHRCGKGEAAPQFCIYGKARALLVSDFYTA